MEQELVTIIMAIYKPNMAWLREQLQSLNAQDYRPLELLIWNDGPADEQYAQILKVCLTNFKYTFLEGKQNLGSTGAFAKLTELAQGQYLAYCDQDDVWYPHKISTLVQDLQQNQATLACSDVAVIDGQGKKIAARITELRPRQTFVEGPQQVNTLLVRNFVMGCTMVVRAELAKQALPFPGFMVHDHWLALWNAMYGKIFINRDSLIAYRLHGSNQTEMLAGIVTKDDYFFKRCLPYYKRLLIFKKRLVHCEYNTLIEQKYAWAMARMKYYRNPDITTFFALLTKIDNNILTTGFELLLPFMPLDLFTFIVRHIRQGDI